MALVLKELLTFAGIIYATRKLEFSATGLVAGFDIDTNWVPPNSLGVSGNLKQSKDYSYVTSHPIDFATGGASFNLASWIFNISAATPESAWPPANDIPMFGVRDTSTGSHLVLNITDNGDGNDKLELKGAGGTVHASAVGVFSVNTDYRIDVWFELGDSADVKVFLTPWADDIDVTSPVVEASSKDFWSGSSGDLVVDFNGQGGTAPEYAVGNHVSTVSLWSGGTSVSEIPGCQMDVILGQTDHTGTTPEADETGDTTATLDTCFGDWSDLVDQSLAITSFAAYNESGDTSKHGGMVECPEPVSDLSNSDFIFGATYKWAYQSVVGGGGNMDIKYGWTTGGSQYDTVLSVNAPSSNLGYGRATIDGAHANCPTVDSQFVMGMHWDATTVGLRYCRLKEMFAAALVRYPLAAGDKGVYDLGQHLRVSETHSGKARLDEVFSG
jgi:hypothetical protein